MILLATEETIVEVETKKSIDELKERIDKLTGLVEKGKGEVEDFAKANPLVSMGVAFLTGMAAGAIVVAMVASRR